MSDTTAPTPDPAPTAPEPRPPKTTPGALPALPAITIGAASLASAIGALGAATGPAGITAIAGTAAVAAGARGAKKARAGGMMRRTVTKTITRSARASGGRTSRAGALRTGGVGRRSRANGATLRGAAKRRATGAVAHRNTSRATGATRPKRANPYEARKRATAARAARRDATAQRRTVAASQRRVARATGAATRKQSRANSRPGRTTTGAGSARVARAHRTNARKTAGASRAATSRAQRRTASTARRTGRVNTHRHKQRTAPARRAGTRGTSGVRPANTAKWHQRQIVRAKRRFRRRMSLTAMAIPALLAAGTWKALRYGGGNISDLARDTYTHILGAARLQRALDLAHAHNAHHDIEPIRETVTTTRDGLETTPIIERSTDMDTFSFRSEAEDILAKVKGGQLGGAMGFVKNMDEMPTSLQAIADAFVVIASRSTDELPIDPLVADALADVHKTLMSAVDAAQEVARMVHNVHQVDIDRLENQRTNEGAWDVVANQD